MRHLAGTRVLACVAMLAALVSLALLRRRRVDRTPQEQSPDDMGDRLELGSHKEAAAAVAATLNTCS